MISTRVGLQAALNGDRTKTDHAATPVSVEELAQGFAHKGTLTGYYLCRQDFRTNS